MEVRKPGGQRRPDPPAERVAWRVLLRSRRGEIGPVVGACEGCGQPMVADDRSATHGLWRIRIPDGDVVVAEQIRGPSGEVWSDDEAHQRIEAALHEPIRPIERLFEGALLTTMAVPILLWMSAVVMVFWFLLNVWKPPGTFP